MAIPISTPTVPDLNVRSRPGLSGEELQIVASAPHTPTMVTQATLGSRQMTVSTSVIQLSSTAPATATHAMISVEATVATDGIRFWEDGSVPTVAQGHKLVNGNFFYVDKGLANFRMIRAQGTDVVVMVTYFKYE